MTEEEIMIRAREAAIATGVWTLGNVERCRRGDFDDYAAMKPFFRVLRDLSKPLSEIQPVDPDWVEAQSIAAQHGWANEFEVWAKCALAALKRGRELERAKP
jgi:hypothetical protein